MIDMQISGSIPSCLLEAPVLRELFLAGNSLSGSIPSIPRNCPLATISASDQAEPFPILFVPIFPFAAYGLTDE